MADTISKAAAIRPPSPSTSGDEGAVQNATTSGTSLSATEIGITAGDTAYRYITMVCTEDAHVCFGKSDMDAATTDDWPLAADVPQTFTLDGARYTHFRAIQDATGGTLKWYVSSD